MFMYLFPPLKNMETIVAGPNLVWFRFGFIPNTNEHIIGWEKLYS
jgi:hypothetical protein